MIDRSPQSMLQRLNPHVQPRARSRREFLATAGAGLGLLGLASLLRGSGPTGSGTRGAAPPLDRSLDPMATRPGDLPVRARSVIWLFMYGGPSGIDLFDPKPELNRSHGKRLEGKGAIDAFFGNPGPLMKSPYPFKQYGKSGAWVSDVCPTLAHCVDDIAFIKSCRADSNNHVPALYQMNTGMTRVGYPSTGSWVTYGLGSEDRNLPGFVVMYDRRGVPVGGPSLWGSAFLPGAYQGTPLRPTGSPLLNLERPGGMSEEAQRSQLDLMAELNEEHQRLHPQDRGLNSRIASFELAYRMQLEAPEVTDLSGESAETRRLYGMEEEKTRHFGTQLLLARRMAERGVRFIQVYSGGPGGDWDAHSKLASNHRERCAETDVPVAGLLTDLKRRGLLDSTLVVWGGEFGRLPVSQSGGGRDHNPHGFLTWMAGGGVKGGISYGETDEVGYKAVADPVSVHDLHATILHQMGIDHTRLTYPHDGREVRLTDVSGRVIEKILA